MSSHLTPLEVLERILGSLGMVAATGGYHAKSPFAWRHGSKEREPGDLPTIPVVRRYHRALRDRGFDVPLDWLIYGADAEAVDALRARRADAEAA